MDFFTLILKFIGEHLLLIIGLSFFFGILCLVFIIELTDGHLLQMYERYLNERKIGMDNTGSGETPSIYGESEQSKESGQPEDSGASSLSD